MNPIQIQIGKTVYHNKSGIEGTVIAVELFNHNLCKRFRVEWSDGTVTHEIAKHLRATPLSVKA